MLSATEARKRRQTACIAAQDALGKIFLLLCSPRSDPVPRAWGYANQNARLSWLTLTRLDNRKARLTWGQLNPTEQRLLRTSLSMMADFFAQIGLVHNQTAALFFEPSIVSESVTDASNGHSPADALAHCSGNPLAERGRIPLAPGSNR